MTKVTNAVTINYHLVIPTTDIFCNTTGEREWERFARSLFGGKTMSRISTFTFRLSNDDKLLLTKVAGHLQRTQSDAMRVLIRQAGRDLFNRERVYNPQTPSIGEKER